MSDQSAARYSDDNYTATQLFVWSLDGAAAALKKGKPSAASLSVGAVDVAPYYKPPFGVPFQVGAPQRAPGDPNLLPLRQCLADAKCPYSGILFDGTLLRCARARPGPDGRVWPGAGPWRARPGAGPRARAPSSVRACCLVRAFASVCARERALHVRELERVRTNAPRSPRLRRARQPSDPLRLTYTSARPIPQISANTHRRPEALLSSGNDYTQPVQVGPCAGGAAG
jgi:hypothetical protein